MSQKTAELKDLYLEVTGTETVTEAQEEQPSRDPLEDDAVEMERAVTAVAAEDGLEDAVAGAEVEA